MVVAEWCFAVVAWSGVWWGSHVVVGLGGVELLLCRVGLTCYYCHGGCGCVVILLLLWQNGAIIVVSV